MPRPLRAFGQEFVTGRRAEAGRVRSGLFAERANIEQRIEQRKAVGLEADPADALRLDQLKTDIEKQTVRTAERKLATRAYRQDQRQMENVRNFWKQRFTGLDQKGPVPSSVKQLDRSAVKARRLAESTTDPVAREANTALADLYEKQAAAKRADEQTGRMTDPQYINDTFAAGVIVESGQIDIVRREIERGILTPDQIFDALLPKETAAYLRESGYTVTPGALQKALDYEQGRADIVDQVSIEAGTYLIRQFSDVMTEARQTGRGTVRGAASPFEPGNYPLPEYVLSELAKRNEPFQNTFNYYVGSVIESFLPELRQSIGEDAFRQLDFENVPVTKLFEFFANTAKDSDTYAFAYNALAQAFDELMTTPDPAKMPEGRPFTPDVIEQIRTFLTDPMIFPAPIRIGGGVERTLQRGAVSRDIATVEPALRQLVDNYGDVLPSNFVGRVNQTLDSLADPGRKFDIDTWRKLQSQINEAIADITKERANTEEQIGVLGERRQQLLGRQQVVENLLRETQIFVENVVRNPEQFFPTDIPEVARSKSRGMLRGVGSIKTTKTISNAIANIDKRIDIFNERLNKAGAFGNFEQQLRQLVEGVKSGLLSLEYINDPNLGSLLQSYGIDSIPKLEQLIDDAFDNPLSTKQLNDLLEQRNDLLQEQQSMPSGTRVGVLQAQFRKPLEADQARMVAEQVDNEAKTATLREEFAVEDAALAEAQAIPGQATALSEQLAQPVGPLLYGERQIPYIPAGVGRGVEQSFGVANELVAEAMAPETVGGIEKIRTGTMVPYTPGQYANRVDQILGQFTRNVVVQNFIRNQEFVSTVADKFTPEQLQALRDEATRRNPETFGADPETLQRRIDGEYQNLLAQEIRKMGLEPISPVQMPDPLDIYAERAALGSLNETVNPSDINENTLLMTEGIRAGLAAEFAPKASNRVPERIQRALKSAQRKTGSWKGVVLPLSLRWQVGDAMGNVLNAWVRGDVPPSELARYANMAYEMMRESQTMDGGQLARRRQLMFSGTLQDTVNNPFLALLESYGLQSSGLKQSDLRSMMTNDQPDLFNVRLQGGLLNRTAAGRGYNRFRTGAFAFNEFQNRLAREAVAMQNLDVYLKENGLTFDDVTVERVLADKQLEAAVVDAVQKANDVLGNFSELSPFERQTMRTIFPFWSWMKFINKAAMQLLIDQPDRLVFMAHLGGLTMEEDAEGLWDFLKGKPVVGGFFTDVGFTNPYSDAIPFMFTGNQNPLTAAIEETQSISPVLSYPLYALGETAYSFTGRQQPLLPTFSRPGYLEGRPGETTRTLGDTLGGLAYYGLKQFGGPARNALEWSPVDFRVPLTDIAVGYAGVPRFPQGSLRTTGQYGVRRLSPNVGRLAAVMRTLGMPSPIVSADVVQRSSFEAQRTGRDALQRRLKQRRLAQR
jgi:hypothetical protein